MVAGGVALVALLAVAAVLGAARPVQRRSRSWTRDAALVLPRRLPADDRRRRRWSPPCASPRASRRADLDGDLQQLGGAGVPLTDDYDFVSDQLRRAQRSLTIVDGKDPFSGRHLNGAGSSLIGDGLATCVRSFDHPELQRARSVILASDNEAAGRSLFTLPEGGQRPGPGIQLYGMNPSDNPSSTRPSRCARSSSPPAGSTSLSTT